jgi:DNA-binding response OmpR family regulator
MKKILLFDDEPWLTDGLVAALESRGFRCLKAIDMTEGVKALRDHTIAALVTDIMMSPGIAFRTTESSEAGFHLIEYVQTNWPRLPIVCLSVVADQAKIRFLKKR